MPTLLLIGAKDDISSPPPASQMVDGARGRSALARIVVYPGALARFRPRQSAAARDRQQRPMPALPEHGHIGTDAEARADSQKRVAEWLAR